jgi:hypothetical protein
MDAFESLVSMLLQHDGYWTRPSFKVELSKAEKRLIGLPSCPRWEIDLVAYKGSTNELLAIECKSFLDSRGVVFRNNEFEPQKTYKLFTKPTLRKVVLSRLAKQLAMQGSCPRMKPTLCMAVGKIASGTSREALKQHFVKHKWELFDEDWLYSRLKSAAIKSYENDIAFVVSKILLRRKAQSDA